MPLPITIKLYDQEWCQEWHDQEWHDQEWQGLQHIMENTAWLDWIAGGLAIVVFLGGLIMLFGGVSAMNRKD